MPLPRMSLNSFDVHFSILNNFHSILYEFDFDEAVAVSSIYLTEYSMKEISDNKD